MRIIKLSKYGITICFLIILFAFGLGIIIYRSAKSESNVNEKQWNYTDNPQYYAYLSMFELNESSADIIFVGDSITARGAYDEFYSDINILNRGIGIDITEGVYNRLDEVLGHHPKKVFIMIGINDIQKGISVSDSMYWYKLIIDYINAQSPSSQIYIEAILPATIVDDDAVRSFNTQLYDLCNRYEKVIYLDTYSLFVDGGNIKTELLSDDGIHLNGLGYKTLTQFLDAYVYF